LLAGALTQPHIAGAQSSAWASRQGLAEARARADTVVVAYIHSARQPRGERGICPADGHAVVIERGDRLAFGDPVSAGVPCAMGSAGPGRPVPMAFMWDGTWARLYFVGYRLVDYEPLRLAAAPMPSHWLDR
jgi:hypothetical protein